MFWTRVISRVKPIASYKSLSAAWFGSPLTDEPTPDMS
jgi:hypothetical protein